MGFSAHGHFTKVGEFQEDLYNKLTTILRYQWWDGASIVQQGARLLAGTTLPNNHNVGRDAAHQITRGIVEPTQKCPVLKALDKRFISGEHSLVKDYTFGLQTTKPMHITCQQAVVNVDGCQLGGFQGALSRQTIVLCAGARRQPRGSFIA